MMRKSVTVSRFAAIAAVLALVTSCAGQNNAFSTTTHKNGDTLRLSHGGDPLSIDPSLIRASQGTQIDMMIAETLTTYFGNGQLQPLLATSWTSNAAQDAWTFTLRSGVKFTDGNPFNATAVQKSITRLLDPALATVTVDSVKFVQSVEVVDDLHVTFHLKQPVRFFPGALSNETSAITSPASWTAPGNTYTDSEHVVGTGPYTLVEYVKNDHVTLTRNDAYWGVKPYYKNQIFQVIPDAAARETAVRSGQLDVVDTVPAPDIDSLKADPSLNVQVKFGNRMNYLQINTTSTVNPALQNPMVRQALNYAVDKNAIIKNILFGAGKLMDSPVMDPSWFGYCATGPYPYDPAKAKQLLQQAGVSNLTITLITSNGRFLQDSQSVQAVAGYLKDVGVTVNGPLVQDNATNQAIVVAPPAKSNSNSLAEAYLWSFAGDFTDASQLMERMYLSTSIPPNSGNNFAHYSNPQVDQLIAKGASDTDPKQAAADYCTAEKQVWADAPLIFLYSVGFILVSSKNVKNITQAPVNGVFNSIYAEPV